MGQPPSRPAPPSPLFDRPWRNLSWENDKNRDFISNFKPTGEDFKHLRILLFGPVGAGKSSFVNSVKNAILKKITQAAAANATGNETQSFTKKFKTHSIIKERGPPKEFFPFVFNDIMGLEGEGGVHPDDIKLILKGHVKESYKFNPEAALSSDDPGYVHSPAPGDKIHVIVCLLSANSPSINPAVLEKMTGIRDAVSDLEIPQVMIVTHIDEACGEIEKNMQNVYKSKFLKKKMEEYSKATRIPMYCIFPVKNYCDEIDPNGDVDTLILSALKQILTFGDDFLDSM